MDASRFAAIVKDIDEHKKKYIDRLKEAVAIPSVSTDPEHRKDIFRMAEWAKKRLEELGAKVELHNAGKEHMHDGRVIDLPPIVFAVLGNDPKKKTLMVYGHLDVQPARKEDGWDTEPFVLTEKNGKLFGRGSSDDKAPVIAWINALETLKRLKIEVPVNLKFVFEGMEESGSKGLEEALTERQKTWLADVDFTCISDTTWLGKTKPCLQYGLRGICYYFLEVSSSKQDLHSGDFGGTVFEPMIDLCWMMSHLTELDGHIKIDGIYDLVRPLTDQEEKLYDAIDFDVADYQKDMGVPAMMVNTKQDILKRRWRYPSLSVHGIEGAFSDPGEKTVIPAKVIGKFSIRLVPDMDPAVVDKLVTRYVDKLWKQRGSPNHYKVITTHGAKAWIADFNHPHYEAAADAIRKVFKCEPDYTREGGSIPITLTIEELTKKNVLLLPFGGCDDMAHSQNEKIDIRNYIEGTKVMAAYLLNMAKI